MNGSRTIIIADSGATKTDWAVLRKDMETIRFRTSGINASTMDGASIRAVLEDAISELSAALNGGLSGQPATDGVLEPSGGTEHNGAREGIRLFPEVQDVEIRMFVAGLVPGEGRDRLGKAVREVFSTLSRTQSCDARNMETGGAYVYAPVSGGTDAVYPCVFLDTDLKGASVALFGDRPGIVAILGTGSNSCLYDGHDIIMNVRPGGFILGDEGSGAALGKTLLADFIKGLLPADISSSLEDSFGLTYSEIVRNVYGGGTPSAYLASFVPFIIGNMNNDHIRKMVEDNFRAFAERSLMPYAAGYRAIARTMPSGCGYSEEGKIPVAVAGSVGTSFSGILGNVLSGYGFSVSEFIQSPVDGLIRYYSNGI